MVLCLYLYASIYILGEGEDLNHGHSNNEECFNFLIKKKKKKKKKECFNFGHCFEGADKMVSS